MLELLLGAELVAVAALLLAAVHCPGLVALAASYAFGAVGGVLHVGFTSWPVNIPHTTLV